MRLILTPSGSGTTRAGDFDGAVEPIRRAQMFYDAMAWKHRDARFFFLPGGKGGPERVEPERLARRSDSKGPHPAVRVLSFWEVGTVCIGAGLR